MSLDSSARPRRRLITGPAIPGLVFLALAIAWSILWYVSANRAETAVETWLADEAAAGRRYACAERNVGGYPFRIEFRCDKPTADLPSDGGPLHVSAERFLAVAQVYRPTHIIGELTGPFRLGPASASPTLEANWTLAQASLKGSLSELDQVSVVFERPKIVVAGESTPLLDAEHLEVHARRPENVDGVDLAIWTKQAQIGPLSALLGGAADVEVQIEATGIADMRPMPLSERLRAFAEAKGRVNVALIKIQTPQIQAQGKGELRLDNRGRPEGSLDIAARGAENIIDRFLGGGGSDLGSLLGMGLNLMGKPAELDGKPATAFELRLDDGDIRLSGIRIGKVPRLY